MTKLRIYISITVSILFIYSYIYAESRSPIKPLLYPNDTISNSRPYIIWKDVYGYKDSKGTKYRITLDNKDKQLTSSQKFIIEPKLYYSEFYAVRLPKTLKNSSYSYTIDRMFNNKPVNSRYFSYLNYPITGSFQLDTDSKEDADFLPPEYLIKYKYFEKENILANWYNFKFFSASSTISLGIGYLFYAVLQFGLISTVIVILSVISAAIGYPAAGYYGLSYLRNKSRINDILKAGKNIGIEGSENRGILNTGLKLRF
jgi:hypothetical protein